jgi:DNA polymerase III gamma/tau subunit
VNRPLWDEATELRLKGIFTDPKGAYIFYGPRQVGKATTARWLAEKWHKPLVDQVGVNPDLVIVEPTAKPSLGVTDIHELIATLSLSRYQLAGRRTVIIDQANTMTTEAQNALLKTLEEPGVMTTIILIASDLSTLLPTIRSRAMAVKFTPLADPVIAKATKERNAALDSGAVERITNLSHGSVGRAFELADEPTQLEGTLALQDAALGILQVDNFTRLRQASQLSEQANQIPQFVQYLAEHISRSVRGETVIQLDPLQGARMLAALDQFEKHRSHHVQLKAALEGLMLELS